jgi:queuine tRNA-ribosyltransferase
VFQLKTTDGQARRGELQLSRGTVQTPAFMPIATQGAIKGGVTMPEVTATGAEIILGNTYHLHRQADMIAEAGQLPKFTNWKKPMLTDSGGFQVFSLANIRKIDDEKVVFKDPKNGDEIIFTPEHATHIQHQLGADIIMQLDHVPPSTAPAAEVKLAMERSLRWAKRCKDFHEQHNTSPLLGETERGLKENSKTPSNSPYKGEGNLKQYLFAIIQGGTDMELRKQSLQGLIEISFPGYAIGGLAVGEPPAVMYQICGELCPLMPADKPRYLMGVGTPRDLIECVERGVDMFDCVLPTRNGRHGKIYTQHGAINMTNARFYGDMSALDSSVHPDHQEITRGYLHHLFKAQENLALHIASLHNIWFYQELMRQMREAIEAQRFATWKADFLAQSGD